MPPRFRTLQIPSSEGGGVDNFCILGPSEVSDSAQSADLELTADILDRICDFGPVARSQICQTAAIGPFFINTTAIWRPNTTHFQKRHTNAQNCMVCGLGVDNFGRGLAVSASKLGQSSHLELTTGPFHAHRHEFAAHTTFQKLQTCNSHRN